MRALITGAGGFAGRHLAAHCRASGDEVVEVSRTTGVDLLDPQAARGAVAAARPEAVYHLAARAHVGESWADPGSFLADNLGLALNVLEAVRSEAPEATVVAVASGEVYGAPASLPVDEGAPLRPQNPYAVSKAACDLLGGQYADATDLRVVRLRPFNHTGPGQSDDYVVGTLTRQVAEAEAAGRDEAVVQTGNPDSARDFSDVRDVVRAYVAAARLDAGVYNVASGHAVSVRELIELVRAAARIPVRHEIDPARMRAHDVAEVRGSAERLRAATGWAPQIPLERTVADALEAWREELGATR